MPVFDSATLQRFYYEGEDHVSHEHPFLVGRTSLDIVSGTSTYTLPDYVVSIRRITFLGQMLDPLPSRNFREVFQSGTQQGKPFWYVYNNIGQNKIQLFPCPNQTVPDVTNVWDSEIRTGCIVEYYRVTDNSTYVIPPYLRRQLLKQYVAYKCYAIEGAGQNIKMRDYFKKKWDIKEQEFFDFLDEIHSKPRKLIVGNLIGNKYYPTSPVLPIGTFGIGVDDGY